MNILKLCQEGSVTMALPQIHEPTFYTEEEYYSLPEGGRSELISGQLYDMAPPNRKHQDILSYLHTEISIYIRSKNGSCKVYPAPFAVKLKEDGTIVEPDISVICSSDKLTDRGCTGAPDWIIEIVSPGNPSHDYVKKLNIYMTAGVREYWIVDPLQDSILQYALENASYRVTPHTFDDTINANIFEGLSIDFSKLDI